MNDIANVTQLFDPTLYADDTTLAGSLCTLDTTNLNLSVRELNLELDNIADWLAVNKLSLNFSKTRCMIFHFYQRRLDFAVIPTLIMKNVPIIRVENFDFLGLTINETLQWTAHLSKISSKILKVTGIMNRLKSYLPISNLKLIYNSLILPHLNYCNLLLGKHSAKIQ